MYTVIISAFPGMGKTYSTKNADGLKVIDHESSNYKWLEDAHKGRFVNPDFPQNYIDKLNEYINASDAPDVIFVSSHSEVREALAKAKIKYYLVAPKQRWRDDIINRYKERGNSEKFCRQLYNNWYKYTDSITNETWPIQIKFNADQFINQFLLDDLINKSTDMMNKTNWFIKRKDVDEELHMDSLFWSIASRTKKFSVGELWRYRDQIDWDILCKFNVLPANAFEQARFFEYYNWKYLNQNIKKYSPKIRKLISSKAPTP